MKNFTVNKQRKKKENASSRFVGVYFNKKRLKWIAQIELNDKCQILGAFDYEIEAAAAYQNKLREMVKAGEAVHTPVFIENFEAGFIIVESSINN